MSVSSSSNASLPPPSLSSSTSLFSVFHECCKTPVGIFNITAFTITGVLVLLPLYIYVLYLGVQRWRQQRSNTTTSHCDVFTYHTVVIELISVSGFILLFCSVHADLQMIIVGICFYFFNFFGQIFFHILTSVERYLAVVHPITYRSLRQERGVRIRNITIGCAWLLCAAVTVVMYTEDQAVTANVLFCSIAFALIVVSFCSFSVLCVLIRPGPGEGGGGRQQVDQSKLRAYYTIMAILGVLLFRFGMNMTSTVLYATPLLGSGGSCALSSSGIWFCLPSSLVLPVLFLQRAGKLLCCKSKNKSGRGSD